jgi:hypothetical protein
MPFWKLIGCLLIFSVSKADVSKTQMGRTFMVLGVKFMLYFRQNSDVTFRLT